MSSTTWPEGVIARYLTQAATVDPTATVDVIDQGEDSYWRYKAACRGCLYEDNEFRETQSRAGAQTHAETCRALPKPDGAR